MARSESESGGSVATLHATGGTIEVPDAQLLFTATFLKSGQDLILLGADGSKLIIVGYFAGEELALLLAPNGASLMGETVRLLAGPEFPGQYAQAGGPAGAEPIGQVETASGTVTVQRANGVILQLKVGDPVFEDDIVITGQNSAVGISFTDETLFSLLADTRMVLDKHVYDPNGSSNSMLFDVIQGTFSVVAGKIAPTGDMLVRTPIATIGVRGTEYGGKNLVQADGAEGKLFVLTGTINILNNLTLQVIQTVSDPAVVIAGAGDGNVDIQPPSGSDVVQIQQIATQLQGVKSQFQTRKEQQGDTDPGTPPNTDGDPGAAPGGPDQKGNAPKLGDPAADFAAITLELAPEGVPAETTTEAVSSVSDASVAGDGEPAAESDINDGLPAPDPQPETGDPAPVVVPNPPQVTQGPDFIVGSSGPDVIDALGGNDIISGNAGNDILSGGAGNDIVDGGVGDDVITGGTGDDTLTGGDGNDTIRGNEGNDTIILGFGAGNDIADGGPDNDTAIYTSTVNGVIVNLETGEARSVIPPDDPSTPEREDVSEIDTDTLIDIENVVGGSGNDIITGTGTANILAGLDGNDRLEGNGGADILSGGAGNDTLVISQDNAFVLDGGEGTDTVLFSGALTLNTQTTAGDATSIEIIDLNTTDANTMVLAAEDVEVISETATLRILGGSTDTVKLDPTFDGAPGGSWQQTAIGTDLDGNGVLFDTFEFVDGSGTLATVHIVQAVNVAPNAVDDSFTTDEDTVLNGTVNVLADNGNGADSDPEGDPLTVQAGTFATVEGGSVVLNADGTFTYTPDANFNGTDSFDYTLEDGQGGSDVATVTIDVAPVNDDPVAQDDSFTTDEDTVLNGTVNVLADNGNGADSDPEGDPLTVQAGTFATVEGGSVVLNADGTFTYTPDANFNGTDSFDYTLEDGQGGSDVATVTIDVAPVNDDPIVTVVDPALDMEGDTGIPDLVTFDLFADLTTASDVDQTDTPAFDGNVSVVAASGSATTDTSLLTVAGSAVSYDRAAFDFLADGESAIFEISFDVTSGPDTVSRTVMLEITGKNDAPTVTTIDQNISEDVANFSVDLFADATADDIDASDTLSVVNPDATIVTNGGRTLVRDTHYTVSVAGPAPTFALTAAGLALFADLATGQADAFTFNYEISDGTVNVPNTLDVDVDGANDPPVAQDDDAATNEDAAVSGNVLTNDSDVDDGFVLTVTEVNGVAADVGTEVTLASGARLTLNSDGTFTYDPNGAFDTLQGIESGAVETDTDSFDYTVSDGLGGSSTATATITLSGIGLTFIGGAGDDVFIGSGVADFISGGAGNDILSGAAGNDVIEGGLDNDVLLGMSGDDVLRGGAGNDLLAGGTEVNFFIGGAGDDVLIGGIRGNNTGIGIINKPSGDFNVADYRGEGAAISAVLTGGLGSGLSTVTGATVGNDTLVDVEAVFGTISDDTFVAEAGFRGQFGSFHEFRPGAGDDTVTGNGATRVGYLGASDGVRVDLSVGGGAGFAEAVDFATMGDTANIGQDTFISGVRDIRGSNFNDVLIGADGPGFQQIRAQAGDDFVDGGTGGDDQSDYRNSPTGIVADLSAGAIGEGTVQDGFGTTDTLVNIERIRGSEFDDDITMDGGANRVDAQDGDDVVRGLGGNDDLRGGFGNDTLLGGADNDTLRGEDGDDRLEGGAGADRLEGGTGLNIFIGGAGDDTLVGGTRGLAGLTGINVIDFNLADYSDATGPITVTLTGGLGSGLSTVSGDASVGTDTLFDIEGVNGTDLDDTFVVDASFVGQFGSFNSIRPGAGDDTITGSDGTRLDYIDITGFTADGGDGRIDGVTVDLGTGQASATNAADAALVGVDSFSGLNSLGGSAFDDVLLGSDNLLQFEQFRGRDGNDLIDGGLGDADQADYRNSPSAIVADLSAGAIGSGTVQDGFGAMDTLIGIERIRGSEFADTITMDNGANVIVARSGDDQVFALGGNDLVFGGDGNDTIEGGGGNDDLRGENDDDTLIGGLGNDTLRGGTGFNILIGGAGDDTLIGGTRGANIDSDIADYQNVTSGNGIVVTLTGALGTGLSTVVGDASVGTDTLVDVDFVRGTAFADTFTIDASFESQFGSFAEIRPLAGDDMITGNGATRIGYSEAQDGVTVNITDGEAFSTKAGDAANIGSDTFSGVNQVRGSNFDDILIGSGADNESFRGQAGNDMIDGGGGVNDRADYRNSPAGVVVDLSGGLMGEGTAEDGFGTTDTLAGIERVRGSEFDDIIIGDAGDNFFIGRDGDDILLGGDGADRIRGDAGEDFIDGGAGTDLLDFSAESINGDRNGFQPLNGVFVSLAALVTIDSFGDRDVVRNVENVRGTNFDDTITGDDLANVLEGRGGNDRLTGGAGDDTVLAGAGFDTIVAGSGAGNDTYDGGGDDDTITFESTTLGVTVDLTAVQDQAIGAETGTDQIANVERVIGGTGDDTITGDGSDNRLEGGAGIDTLNGGAGNDDLIGGAGNDIINGGDGSDFIRPGAGDDTIDGGADFDVVSYRDDATGSTGITYTGGVDPSNGDTTGTVTGDASIGTDSLRNIEMIIGTEFQDVFNGGAGDERFDPLGGIDTINGGGGDFDQLAYQSATPGPGNSGVTITFTAPGTGTAFDTAGDLDSFTGIEMAFGSAGNDVITMSTADSETVFASRGNDDVDGGAGIGDNISYCCDNFFGVSINLATGIADDGAGSVHQLSGFENADGSSGVDQITGDGGGNNLFGLGGGDTIDGGAGDDFLFGNEGDDILAGGLNDDVLSGGLGLDELTGGAGADEFEFVNGTLDAEDLIFDFDVAEIDAILLNVQAAAEVDPLTDTVDDFLRVIDVDLNDPVNGLVLQADVDGAAGPAGFETIADFVDETNLGAGIQVTVIDDDGSNVSGNIVV